MKPSLLSFPFFFLSLKYKQEDLTYKARIAADIGYPPAPRIPLIVYPDLTLLADSEGSNRIPEHDSAAATVLPQLSS